MNGDNDASGTGNIAAPVFGTLANFFGNSPSGDGETLSQDMYNEIARASAAAAEAAFGATNQVTPQPLSRAPNPALTPLPPVTPIVNTSLSELRAARAAESGGGITSSKGASKSSKDDDDKTTTELVTEAISKGLKQERTLRAKVMANKESTLWWLLKQIKALLIKFGISDLTKWQITTILLGTYFLWPKLKPSMRLLLHRVHLQVLSARDSLMSKVAAHIIGLTTTGVTFAIASRTSTNTDEDPEPSAAPTGAPTVEISSRSSTPLSPIPESPASRRAAMLNVETGTDSDNESVPPLEEPSPEADKPEADAASSPSTTVSQWQSNVKPTESGGTAVQDAQVVQVQPEVPVPSESISMNTVKLAVPMNVSRKITLKFTDAQRAVMFNTSAGIPNDAMLFDNGATLNCIKTDAGRLVGSFIENADGDISVGDESSSLASNGSYLHALTFTDADGKKIDTQVCISSAGDDNESMGKLFVSNLKAATSKLSESTNTYALRLAENAAELKIAMLRTCTKYAKYLDESTACNAEPRIEHLMEQINLATDGNAATYVANAFNAKKAKYTALQWQDMADQRLAWLKKTRPRDYITFANKCCDAHTSATPSAASPPNLATPCTASPPNSTKVTPLCTDNIAAAKLLLTATGPAKCCNVTDLLT